METSETKSKGTSDMCRDITNKEQPCVETSQNKELEVPEPCVGESETKGWRYLRYVWINHKQDHTVEVSEIRVETSEIKSWRYLKHVWRHHKQRVGGTRNYEFGISRK